MYVRLTLGSNLSGSEKVAAIIWTISLISGSSCRASAVGSSPFERRKKS